MSEYIFHPAAAGGFGALPGKTITSWSTSPTVASTAPAPVPVKPAPLPLPSPVAPTPLKPPSVSSITKPVGVSATARPAPTVKPAVTPAKGPPPWANASFMRDADKKVAGKIPPGVKKLIDSLPLSSNVKSGLKTSPLSTLVGAASEADDRRAMVDFINKARAQGANVAAVAASDNPAAVAAKLVQAAAAKPSAAVKAAAEKTLSGYSGFGAVSTTEARMIGLAPALVALSPITLPALQSIAASKPVAIPTASQVAAAASAANTGTQMQNATAPEATAAATAAAAEENKILGLPPIAVYGAGAALGLGMFWRILKKK